MENTRFTDNGDGTITDTSTGLTWQQEDDGKEYNWFEANEYAKKLSLAGYSDWRLPSVDELAELAKKARNGRGVFPNPPRYYWSGTPSASYTNLADR